MPHNLPKLPAMDDIQDLLRFELDEGRIWMGEERMILLRSSELQGLRRELIESLGMEAVVDLHLGADPIKAVVPPNQRLNEGEPVWLQFDLTRIHFFDPDSGDRLYTTGPEEELECPEPESS